jgi:photosystem II stability/assembly factor-like uncharacterized protein
MCTLLKVRRLLLAMTGLCFAAAETPAQPWMESLPAEQRDDFYTIQKSFNAFWKDRDTREKGKGWKQFKRWEWFWEQRVYPDGQLPDPMHLYRESLREQERRAHNPGRAAGTWTEMGPYESPGGYNGLGRLNCVRPDPFNEYTIWVGSASGGLWKTTDAGFTWTTTTDELPSLGVTDIVIDPTNPSIMYIGTGDGDAGDTYSTGVLKSTDGGETWNTTGLNWSTAQTRRISRLLMHPNNPSVLFAAGNGIFKSTNAGTSWMQVSVDVFRDMEFKPGAPDTMYASGNSATIYRSTNGGATWQSSSTGISGGIGRIALGVSPANPEYVYALAANNGNSGFSGFFRSTNSGATWAARSSSPNLLGWAYDGSDAGGQGWYDLAVAVSQTNAELVFVGGVNNWRSTNGGTSWILSSLWYNRGGTPTVHADQHDLYAVPNSDLLFAGNDGGIYVTIDQGVSWTWLGSGLKITQFYRLGTSATDPGVLIAGAQDNGTKALGASAWNDVLGGDGMEALVDHTNAGVMFGSLYYGDIYKSVNGGLSFTSSRLGINESGAWVTPYVMHPTDPNILFAGFSNVWKSSNGGAGWNRLGLLGGSSLTILTVAPSDPDVIYCGRSAALIRSTDGGSGWTNLPLPAGTGALTYCAVHPQNPDILWVTSSGYSAGNKVYRSDNGGSTWTNISGTLPNVPVNCIVFQNNSPERLYVGTDIGVYYRDLASGGWQDFNTGLANVVISELEIQYSSRKIRAATYGRGVWESDLIPDQGIVVGQSPAAIHFGQYESGQPADTTTVTIASYGSDTLVVSTITNAAGAFTIIDAPPLPAALAPLQSLTFGVVFTPLVHGLVTDTLAVATNAPVSPTRIPLSGKGVTIGPAGPGAIYAASAAPASALYTLDPVSGNATAVGPLGISELQGLTIHPVTHELYGIVSGSTTSTLYRVSSGHGDVLATRALRVGGVRALAFATPDTLFAATVNGRLYRIPLATGDSIPVGPPSGLAYASLSVHPLTNELWASVRPPVANRDRIYTVNTNTGEPTLIGATGDGLITPGLAFRADGLLYGLKGAGPQINSLIVVNTSTGAGTTVGSAGISGLQGLALRSDTLTTGVMDEPAAAPSRFVLHQNYPNPFNPSTRIGYSLPVAARVRVQIFTVLGQNIATLIDADQEAGEHHVGWSGDMDGRELAGGLYFYQITAVPVHGGTPFQGTGKMLMLR